MTSTYLCQNISCALVEETCSNTAILYFSCFLPTNSAIKESKSYHGKPNRLVFPETAFNCTYIYSVNILVFVLKVCALY